MHAGQKLNIRRSDISSHPKPIKLLVSDRTFDFVFSEFRQKTAEVLVLTETASALKA